MFVPGGKDEKKPEGKQAGCPQPAQPVAGARAASRIVDAKSEAWRKFENGTKGRFQRPLV
jgi:hypothetical protein